ncbi:unnamed protein product [Sphagnum balticum]
MNPADNNSSIQKTTNFKILSHPQLPALPPLQNGAKILAANPIIKPVELVTGIIHQGTKVILGGSSKAGKTWLLLNLGLSVATGTDFLRWPVKSGRVLYLNFEIAEPFMVERLNTLAKQLNLTDLNNLDVWNLRGKTSNGDALLRQVLQITGQKQYTLIILDPIYKLMTGKSENTAGGVNALCHQLERLMESTGATIVYAHHYTKGRQNQKKAIDRLSGSGVFSRDADSIVLFTDHAEPGCFTVDMILRNFPPQPSFVMEWQFPVMVERRDLEPDGANQLSERTRQVLGLVAHLPMTTLEWQAAAQAQGIPRASFFRVMRELREANRVTMNSGGRQWSAAPELSDIGQNEPGIKSIKVSASPGSQTPAGPMDEFEPIFTPYPCGVV